MMSRRMEIMPLSIDAPTYSVILFTPALQPGV